MNRYATVLIFLSICFIISSSCNELIRNSEDKHEAFIRGTYHAWWVILGVETSSAIHMMNAHEDMSDVKLMNKTFIGFPPNQHPVLFEIGKEYNCGPSVSSALRSDFLEFKFEIPFVTSLKSKKSVLNYKQKLFESSSLNSISSNIMYGLDASKANMNMSDSSYEIKLNQDTFIANFSTTDDQPWIRVREFSFFKPYETIMNLTWFGRRKYGVCAEHNYDFGTALVKPSRAHLMFNKSMINPYFPHENYDVDQLSSNNLFGAVQIKINFTMTLPKTETSEIQTTEITPDSNKENIPPDFNKENTVAIQTEGGWADPIDILSLTVQKEILERDLARKILDNEKLTLNNASRKSQKIFQVQQRERSIFSAENFTKDDKMLRYYSGFNNTEFNAVFKFLVPDSSNYPLKMSKNMKIKIKIKDQFFFTLCKLRNNLDFTDLGYRFQISTQDCSSLFCDWINFMYLRFGAVCTWPPRDMIIKNMPENYKRDFPNTLAIIDGTEIKIQKPSSLHAQSQSYSNYKSTNTLKALVAVDPRGSLLFTSCLFSGAISDKDIFEQSGLKKMLQNLVQHGHIKEGDGIMADKGFNIHKEVEDCKLKLNIPPFANAGLQMTQADALLTKKIAAHRVHVERTIGSVKKFKIVGQKVPLSLFGRVNQIWNVCCFLTTFQKPIIRRK
ncbi:uncharacterized protein LOC134706102 [Mytilus trossulus]|uniref:uncharacterized protein LOC134706102 n=1 Tax=Mytilus trossulus TaxID=6551 RepID=UPI0030040FC0